MKTHVKERICAPLKKFNQRQKFSRMMVYDPHPIFCDHCSFMAIAELDGEILCIGCLMTKVSAPFNKERINRIIPLDLSNRNCCNVQVS